MELKADEMDGNLPEKLVDIDSSEDLQESDIDDPENMTDELSEDISDLQRENRHNRDELSLILDKIQVDIVNKKEELHSYMGKKTDYRK